MKLIPLSRGKKAIVDDEDFGWLSRWNWYFNGSYAIRVDGKKTVYMHREILKTPKGKETDHIDGNKINNRRKNLRVANRSQNSLNKAASKGKTSRYKGVCWDTEKGKWLAQIQVSGRPRRRVKFLGRFQKEKDAASAYNKAAIELHGKFVNIKKYARRSSVG